MKPYYQRGGVTLYHADCRDVLPGLPRIELLLTDPPYGVRASTTGMRANPLPQSSIANDSPEDAHIVEDGIVLAWSKLAPSRHAYVFGPFDLSKLKGCSETVDLVWNKVAVGPGDTSLGWSTSHERIVFGARMEGTKADKRGGQLARVRRGSVLTYPRPIGARVQHPTEKPVPLLRELIEMSSKHGETVLDPFAGSGSTLVAALIEGRQAIGIELDEPWCEVAAKRLDDLTRQVALFGGVA